MTRMIRPLALFTLFALALGCDKVDVGKYAGVAVDKVEGTLMQLHVQDSVRPEEGPQPSPPESSVPVGVEPPLPPFESAESLVSPLSRTPQTIEAGRLAYRRFCWQCHGPDMDGQSGTVGPSLPHGNLDLLADETQAYSDGELFWMTSEGWRYHPPLNSTMTRREMWESIAFIRAVANGNAETGAPANYRIGARPIDPDQRFVNPNP